MEALSRMKLNRTFLAVLIGICFLSPWARAEEKTFEVDYLSAMLLYCMPPVVARDDVARVAAMKGLQEFPAEQAQRFDKTGGRVFLVPSKLGNAVLVAPKTGGCQIIARRLDTGKFWPQADRFFGAASPFKVLSDITTADEHQKKFIGDFSGPTALMVSTRNNPASDGVQAVMTFARVQPGTIPH
jgi:hypothetical protein